MADLLRLKGKTFGHSCEELAATFFRQQGYNILEVNFRARCGEIDIVAEKDGYIVFIEVKARKSTRYGLPQEAVTPAKQAVIRKTATAFLQKRSLMDKKVRFDVLAITFPNNGGPRFNHIPFAF